MYTFAGMETSISSYILSSKQEKMLALEKMLKDAETLTTPDIEETEFQNWKLLSESLLNKLYGSDSTRVKDFLKLRFRHKQFDSLPYNPAFAQNELAFKNDLAIAMKVLSQCLEELRIDSLPISAIPQIQSEPVKKELRKISWKGTQKELAELFVELKNKGWISEIEPNLIQEYFKESKTIKQVLKPSKDKDGNANYDGIYTKVYKPKFDSIRRNEKE
jgi:hypothetical protein